MDDLTTLRDLGRDLEHEPPATLARQRNRLLDAAAGVRGRRRVPGWTVLGLAAVLTAVVLAVPSLLLRAGAPINRLDTYEGLASNPAVREAITVLLVGTDGGKGADGASAVSLTLARVTADRKDVTVADLPADLVVGIPRCRTSTGETAARTGVIGGAFATAGMPCLWKTVETITRVRVDHTVEVSSAAFTKLVDELGGVELTLPRAVHDPKSGLRLPAGRSLLDGERALAYIRSGSAPGGDSARARAQRRQQVIGASLKKAADRLTEPARLLSFLRKASGLVTTDAGLTPRMMSDIALETLQAQPPAVHSLTIPVRSGPTGRLELSRPAADRVFRRFADH
ncbi:hypothetical protein Skr01_46830 [Sphaerisporangium krabiense]|uniref:LCP family protein required for cell wall assembly n=1 Tax=Sphaerisporangium krabiense TaxID=763782 RepID=A0A7W8Z543_9ACTN|nr:LCP family protein [Sphaerisporangium krabiense]MBB5627268.1 LCP family protein required for cell wall assembly [Sphaerisporangium krabiense]GII64598.1 hypothetical protein Skr01_46830 [Sphaerisporangium krabiense]